MTETLEKNCNFLNLAHVLSANMERVGFMTCTTASHQGSIEMFWLHFWGAVMSSIFINNLWTLPRVLFRKGLTEVVLICI